MMEIVKPINNFYSRTNSNIKDAIAANKSFNAIKVVLT
jgi:hypothetical protein